MKNRTLAGALALAVAAAAWTIGPAAAAEPSAPPPPTLSNLDGSTPGHLLGTAHSVANTVVVIRFAAPGADGDQALVQTPSGTADFDISTWGHKGVTPLYVRACDVTTAVCSDEVQAPQTFVATDLAPSSAVWSADTTVGRAQDITVTTNDSGAGRLLAIWYVNGSRGADTEVNHQGQTVVEPWVDGVGNFTLARCDSSGSSCVSYPALTSPTYNVRRNLPWVADSPAPITPTNNDSAVVVHTVANYPGMRYDVSWQLLAGGVAVAGTSRSVSDLEVPASGVLTFPVSGTGLADGTYEVAATGEVRVPSFGAYPVTFGLFQGPALVVDRTSTVQGVSASPSTIYPNIDQPDRPGTTYVSWSQHLQEANTLVMRSSSGAAVRSFEPVGGSFIRQDWDGRDDDGKVVPSGSYTAVIVDSSGNVSPDTTTVKVDARRRVLRSYVRTVTARASLLDAYVGKCSTLRRPSTRGWAGSLGFYANTRCRTKTWKASAVSTAHRIRLPAHESIKSLDLDVYGGAARTKRHSLAWVRFLTTRNTWRGDHVQTAKVGWHKSYVDNPKSYVQDDNAFIWGFYTAAGRRYDVAKFQVRFQYYVLQ